MSTYLGAAQTLSPSDVEAALPERAALLLVEGYLWDWPEGTATIEAATAKAKASGGAIALTPSDAGCIECNQDAMLAFLRDHCNILVGNQAEIGVLSGETAPEEALRWPHGHGGSRCNLPLRVPVLTSHQPLRAASRVRP